MAKYIYCNFLFIIKNKISLKSIYRFEKKLCIINFVFY